MGTIDWNKETESLKNMDEIQRLFSGIMRRDNSAVIGYVEDKNKNVMDLRFVYRAINRIYHG